MTWPPRWTPGPHFKDERLNVRATTKARATKGRGLKTAERKAKTAVRQRDRTCRFPACGCGRRRYALAVCHQRHKGMGGNPKGDRSRAETMLLLCAPRHRESPYAIDKGTLRYLVLDPAAGTAGPLAWQIRAGALPLEMQPPAPRSHKLPQPDPWIDLARETAPHVFLAFTPRQLAILTRLRESMA